MSIWLVKLTIENIFQIELIVSDSLCGSYKCKTMFNFFIKIGYVIMDIV